MIDWRRVTELRTEVGEIRFRPMVELFLDEIEGVMMRLYHDDVAMLQSDLYFLQGCAANLGFTAFWHMCHQGEEDLRDGRTDQIDLSMLMACYAETKKSFFASMRPSKSGVA